jgi:serine/threonine-protein kinase
MEDLRAVLETHLSDTHRVVRQLGSGGMATVFLVTDTKHDRQVALKVLRPEVAGAVGAGRFLREIETAARLTHPHLLPLHDSGQIGDLLYYSMPFVDGESLRSRIDREGALPIADAVSIATECADGLSYAHEHGIIHRDVKPGNILLSADHAVLADFGIARALEEAAEPSLTTQGVAVGTVGYMSPEQATGEGAVDERSDVYAVGCVLYEMLTGERPFAGRTRVATIARQLAGPPTPVAVLRPEVPEALRDVVARCLARTPADRFLSADELRAALRRIQGALGTLPITGSTIEGRGRGRALLGTAAVVAVTLAGLLLVRSDAGILSGAELDPTKIVVFPLANRGGGENAGADVALMIGNALVHTDPLRWIDGWEQLTPSERGDPSMVTSARALAIARERGAAHYLTGALAWSDDSVTVRLILHDAKGDSVTGQASASGLADSGAASRLGLQSAMTILPILVDPGRRVDLSPLTERAPAAVALWMQGDRAYREARFGEALELYQRAVGLDSLLTLAALKGGLAASWRERPELAMDLLDLAVRHDSILPAGHRAFAHGLRAHEAGEADLAIERFREALAVQPDWAEAWAAIGETYRHLFPDSAVEMEFGRRAFAEAVRLDSTFSPALVHLAEAAIASGDLDRGRSLLQRVQAAGAEPSAVDWVVLMEACAAPPRVREEIPRAPAAAVILASQQLAAGGRHLRCGETGFVGVLERDDLNRAERWSATMGLMGVLTIENRVEELAGLLDETLAAGEGSTRFLYALGVAAGIDLRDRAAAVDAEAEAMWAPDYEATGPHTLWLLTLWNSLEGDLAAAEVLSGRLAEVAEEGADPLVRVLADAARAHVMTARGDSAAALSALQSLDPAFGRVLLDYGLVEPLAPERMLLAELLLADGEAEEAYRTAALFDHPGAAIFVPFVARSLELRARAARAMPGREWAERARNAEERLEMLGRPELVRQP